MNWSALVRQGRPTGAVVGETGVLLDRREFDLGPGKRPLALRAQADIGTTDSPANFAEVRY